MFLVRRGVDENRNEIGKPKKTKQLNSSSKMGSYKTTFMTVNL